MTLYALKDPDGQLVMSFLERTVPRIYADRRSVQEIARYRAGAVGWRKLGWRIVKVRVVEVKS